MGESDGSPVGVPWGDPVGANEGAADGEWDTVGAGEIVGDELMDLAVMVGEPVG
jgi:hypothetical protein